MYLVIVSIFIQSYGKDSLHVPTLIHYNQRIKGRHMQAASTIKLYDMDTNMLNKENRDEIIKNFFYRK